MSRTTLPLQRLGGFSTEPLQYKRSPLQAAVDDETFDDLVMQAKEKGLGDYMTASNTPALANRLKRLLARPTPCLLKTSCPAVLRLHCSVCLCDRIGSARDQARDQSPCFHACQDLCCRVEYRAACFCEEVFLGRLSRESYAVSHVRGRVASLRRFPRTIQQCQQNRFQPIL